MTHKIKSWQKYLLSISSLLLLGGCTLTPDYHTPDLPVPEQWPQGSAYPAPSEPAAPELTWREVFTDPKLRQVIELALTHNRDLQLAALNVEQARALHGLQRDNLYPVFNLTASGSRQQASADLTAPDVLRTTDYFDLKLGVASWEIDLFGRIRSQKDQALQEYLSTAQMYRGAQNMLIFETARMYLTLAADREKLSLAQSTLRLQQNAAHLVEKQFKADLAREIDFLRSNTQVDLARADAARYTTLAAQSRNALELLAGEPLPEDLLVNDLATIALPLEISAGISSDILLNRPDIMAAEHQLQASYALIGAARAAFFPRIGLTTAIGTASDELSRLLKSDTGVWNFTPQLSLPIFDARVWAAHRLSKVNQKTLLAQYEKTIQTAFREIADVLAVKGTISQQLEAQQAITDAAQKIHKIADKRYQHGLDSYLSVLDAQRSFYAAQQALISLRLQKIVNTIHLYAALGGDKEISAPASSAAQD